MLEGNAVNLRPASPDDIRSMIALERECDGAAHWTEEQYQRLFGVQGGGFEWIVLVAEGTAEIDSQGKPHPSAGSGQAFSQRTREMGHAGLRPEGGQERPPHTILGFMVASYVSGEWELGNIVVDPEARRKGLGMRLLDSLLTEAKRANSEAVFLEVRESNSAARKLYEKAGFEQTGRRKSYYVNPSEDAVVYRHSLN